MHWLRTRVLLRTGEETFELLNEHNLPSEAFHAMEQLTGESDSIPMYTQG